MSSPTVGDSDRSRWVDGSVPGASAVGVVVAVMLMQGVRARGKGRVVGLVGLGIAASSSTVESLGNVPTSASNSVLLRLLPQLLDTV